MLKSLQAGRAIAALMVVGFHLGLAVDHFFGVSAFRLPFGHAGVEFFFVLSGFIITRAHAGDVGQPSRIGRFLWKRFARIYPIYWIVFLAAYAGAYRIVHLSPADLARALALVPADTAPVISVAWSLQWEVVFYLLFAAFILNPWLGLLAMAGAFAGLPGSHVYLLLFLAGVASAWIDQRRLSLPGPALVALGGQVFAGACAYDAVTGMKPTAWLGVGAAILVLGLSTAERTGRVFGAHRVMQLLGDASYCLYLIHYPLISAAVKVTVLLGLAGPAWGVAFYPVVLLASLWVSIGLHLWVEKPLLARLNRR